MNILVLTGYDDAMQELGDICLPSKRAYAERHGYAFECVREYPTDVHPSWHKLQLLKDRIDRYDAILWLDADSIVTNATSQGQFMALFAHEATSRILMVSQDWCAPKDEPWISTMGISFGNFVLFNRPDTHRWLVMAMRHTQYAYRSTCCWEQDAVLKCMRESEWFNMQVGRMPRRTLNAVHPDCKLPSITAPDPWQPGDFLIHLTNLPDRIERAKEFAQWALKNA